MRAPSIFAPLVALALAAGCSSGPDPGSQTGYPNGFETEVKTAVAFKNPPKDSDAPLVSSVDAAVAKVLETDRDRILEAAIAAFNKEQPEEGTKVSKENCELVAEDFNLTAEDNAATRKMFEGKVTKFRFMLRRPKARIVPDPQRIEVVVSCVERSWAPGDTLRFPQIFRAEVMDRLAEEIYDVTGKQGLDPVKPRKVGR